MLFLVCVLPFIVGIYLAVKNSLAYKGYHYGEYLAKMLLIFQIPTIFTAMGVMIPYGISSYKVMDKEYWGSYGIKVHHEEPWNEYIYATCTRTVSCGKDCTTTETYDCSYVLYHPDYKTITDSLGVRYFATDELYRELVGLWGNEKKVGHHSGYTQSGDIFEAYFPGTDNKMYNMVTVHNYKNPIQISHNVLNFPEVDKKTKSDYKLYEYPSVNSKYYAPSILGSAYANEHKTIDLMNAKLGSPYQIKVFILIFGKDRIAFQEQRNLWKNGNKNELVICVGVDEKRNIVWGDCFSWTDIDLLKVEVTNWLGERINKRLDIVKFAEWLEPEIKSKWKRKEFKDFMYLYNNRFGFGSYTFSILWAMFCVGATIVIVHKSDGEFIY